MCLPVPGGASYQFQDVPSIENLQHNTKQIIKKHLSKYVFKYKWKKETFTKYMSKKKSVKNLMRTICI